MLSKGGKGRVIEEGKEVMEINFSNDLMTNINQSFVLKQHSYSWRWEQHSHSNIFILLFVSNFICVPIFSSLTFFNTSRAPSCPMSLITCVGCCQNFVHFEWLPCSGPFEGQSPILRLEVVPLKIPEHWLPMVWVQGMVLSIRDVCNTTINNGKKRG